ncbi:non-ribosomal peptide synthetase [Bacillus cereus]|uniref:non-ribosomal peptide synthetase n=1 Tax=Bacillus cereus TaxID=1396 RepID=UPI0036434247
MDNIENILELTPLQNGILFHSIINNHKNEYIVHFSCDLTGELNIELFKNAWDITINKHHALKSSFHWEGLEKPFQVIHKEVSGNWEILDISEAGKEEQSNIINEYTLSSKKMGIDISVPPLIKFTLFKLNKDKYHFLWIHHHLLLDGWSFDLVMDEVTDMYEKLNADKFIELKNDIQFENYIGWLQNQKFDSLFWENYLKGFDQFIEMRNTFEEDVFAFEDITLSLELTENLKEFAAINKVTLNTIIQSAWSFVLSKYQKKKDLVYGITMSGRTADVEGVEKIVGMLINTVPMRINFNNIHDFNDLIKTIYKNQLSIQEHEHSSLIDISKSCNSDKGLGLFEHLYIYESFSGKKDYLNKIGNIRVSNVQHVEATNYPLVFTVIPNDNNLYLELKYKTKKYKATTIKDMLNHLIKVLADLASNNVSILDKIDKLKEDKPNKTLQQFNSQKSFKPIIKIFEEVSQKYSNKEALVFNECSYTYSELNERANQIANYLVKKGVRKGERVAILLDKSIDGIATILSILKLGGTFVPIDINAPKEKVKDILVESCSQYLIQIQGESNKKIAFLKNIIIGEEKLERESKDNLNIEIQQDESCYIIFTSGSTGKPKGVLISNKNLSSIYYAWVETFGISNLQGRHLQMASVSFDVFIGDITRALCSGGTLVLCPKDVLLDSKKLYCLIEKESISIAEFVPVVLRNLYNYMLKEQKIMRNMEVIICGSDVLYVEEYTELIKVLPNDCKVFNTYGLSECTIDSTYYNLTSLKEDKLIPIGQAFSNTIIYILDEELSPVPDGVVGELYISGNGVATGYINNDIESKERFLLDENNSIHMYKTGDMGYWDENGNIILKGRKDNQIKIRGHRIELREIEEAIMSLENVKATVVLTTEKNKDEKLIVAYVSFRNFEQDYIKSLRNKLKDKLPYYMIPNIFIEKDEFLLNSNGKIDRNLLVEEIKNKKISNEETEFVLPQNEKEKSLCDIWSSILQINSVSMLDNFFELGGHSLMATQIISRVKEEFNVDLPIKYIFDFPVLKDLYDEIIELEKKNYNYSSIQNFTENLNDFSEDEVDELLNILLNKGE